MNNQEILNALNEKIKAAEEALLYLNQSKAGIERLITNNVKTPEEEAFKRFYDRYPNTDVNDACWEGTCWEYFRNGYNAGYLENPKIKEERIQQPYMINCIIEGDPPDGYVTWQEWFSELGSKGILHNLRISSKEHKNQEVVEKLQEKNWYVDANTLLRSSLKKECS